MKHEPSRRTFLQTLVTGVAAGASPAAALPNEEAYWEMVRRQFPFDETRIPMNAGNLCPSPRRVSERVALLTRDIDRDISYSNRAKFAKLLERSRENVARHLHAEPDEIALVRNTSEANATVVTGLALGPGDEVLLWSENHPTNNVAWDVQSKRRGFDVRRLDTPADPKNPEQFLELFTSALTDRTRVLALSHVSNYSGIRLPIRDITRAAHARDVFVLIDGAQTWGALDVDLTELGCDAFTASTHKWLCGPKEAGILFLRRSRVDEVWPHTVSFGWDEEIAAGRKGARKFETLGQRDDAAVAAVGTAIDFHTSIGAPRIESRVYELSAALWEGLSSEGLPLLTPREASITAGVVTVRVPMERRRPLVFDLDELGIAGSPAGGLRLCPHIYNTMAHVERAVKACGRLRAQILG